MCPNCFTWSFSTPDVAAPFLPASNFYSPVEGQTGVAGVAIYSPHVSQLAPKSGFNRACVFLSACSVRAQLLCVTTSPPHNPNTNPPSLPAVYEPSFSIELQEVVPLDSAYTPNPNPYRRW